MHISQTVLKISLGHGSFDILVVLKKAIMGHNARRYSFIAEHVQIDLIFSSLIMFGNYDTIRDEKCY